MRDHTTLNIIQTICSRLITTANFLTTFWLNIIIVKLRAESPRVKVSLSFLYPFLKCKMFKTVFLGSYNLFWFIIVIALWIFAYTNCLLVLVITFADKRVLYYFIVLGTLRHWAWHHSSPKLLQLKSVVSVPRLGPAQVACCCWWLDQVKMKPDSGSNYSVSFPAVSSVGLGAGVQLKQINKTSVHIVVRLQGGVR